MPVLALFLAFCGGGEPSADSDSDDLDRALQPDSVLAPGGAGADPDIPPADTGAWVIEPGAGASPDPSGWTAGASSGGSARGIATLVAVRSARHADYDRIVLEFDTHVPGYRVDYVDSPQYECGSGEAVRVAGDAWLQISLEPANAHTEEGQPTAGPRRVMDPPGDNLLELRRICDFEAHVELVVGVATPNAYRAMTLEAPARLVVDIKR